MMDALKKVKNMLLNASKLSSHNAELEIESYSATSFISVLWKIKNSRLTEAGRLRSPTFNCCNATWALDVYLARKTSDSSMGYIMLYVRKVLSSAKVHSVEWKIGIKDIYNRNQYTFQHESEFEGNESGWGQKQGIEIKELLEKRRSEFFRNDDTLTVFCELKIYYGANIKVEIHGQTRENQDSGSSSIGNIALSSDFQTLLESGRNSDVSVQVGDETLPAHKTILVARSPVFAAMFEHDMKESRSNIITINDIEPDVFKNVLCYIYTGRSKDLSYNSACDLYVAADKYDLGILKEQCVETMLRNLSVENVCELAVLADTYSDEKIMFPIKTFILENASFILDTNKWIEVVEERPRLASSILRNMSSDLATRFPGLPMEPSLTQMFIRSFYK